MTGRGISLTGRRILIVEDNFHIATALAKALKAQGMEIIGPVGTLNDAPALVAKEEQIDGAMLMLDVNLHGELVYADVKHLHKLETSVERLIELLFG